MYAEKERFLTEGTFAKLENLQEETPAKWGVMNAQQMVEHLSDFYNISLEKIKVKLLTPEAHLPKYKEFLLSDKEFRENTKAPEEMLGDEPNQLRSPSLSVAKDYLKSRVKGFTEYFTEEKQTLHPVFGMLTYEEWVLLHHKHVMHHLKQFGLM